MNRRLRLVFALLLAVAGAGAVPAAATSPDPAPARHCTDHPFDRASDFQAVANDRSVGFGIGDITAAVPLPDGRRFVTLGDTLYYNLTADGRAGPLRGFGDNSAWVQSGNCVTLLDRPGPGLRSWLLPPERDGSVYWPGGAVVVGNRLYVFLTRLFLDNPFGTPVGSAVASFNLPSLSLARITPIPFEPPHVFGIGAVYDGGYVYTYASRRNTCKYCFAGDLFVARARESNIWSPASWRYRSGSQWVTDPDAATPVLRAGVSNADVHHYGNGFLLITKPMSIVAPQVEARWSPTPIGPWQDLGTVYTVPQPPDSWVPGFTYHQSYTYGPTVLLGSRLANGGYLASYNVNSFDPADGQTDGRMGGPRFLSVRLPPPPAAPARPQVEPGPSPWIPTFAVDRLGNVRTTPVTNVSSVSHTAHAVAIARTPSARGGWVAAADGGVFTFGDAQYFGSMGGTRLNKPIVGIAATPSGKGYWLVASDGGIFSFGDARFFGSTGAQRLNQPILAMAATPSGKGYWFVASDGGVFAFGDARFLGSTGGSPPPAPVTGMATTPDGRGYWLATRTGQVFAFGDANFAGSVALPATSPCIGIVPAPGGYRLVARNGTVFLRGATRGRIRIASATPLVAAG